jgi:membrane-bound lytic murein transglycosylase D
VNRWATDPEGPHRLLVPIGSAGEFARTLASLNDENRVRWTRHRVKQGETIGGLATKYHTTAAVLRDVNELRGNSIRAGEYLLIPHALQSLDRYSLSADARAARRQAAERPGVRSAHVVASGETLWGIARRYGVDVRTLASWNSMAPGDVLGVGRELVLWTQPPGGVSTLASVAASPVPAAALLAGSAGDRIRQVTYTVRRGDSLSSIARRFRVTVPNLVKWNDVAAPDRLRPGQRLVMFVDVREQSG